MPYKLKTFTDTESYWKAITAVFAKSKAKQDKENPFTLVASGGSAVQLFDQDLDLSDTKIFIADERFVPENNPDSNAKALREKNLGEKLVSWNTDYFDDAASCARVYQEYLPKSFDLMILGVGPDGHTASLFPHIEALDEKKQRCVATETEVFSVKERVSMSFSTISTAKKIMILMMGKGKRKILEKITNPETDFHDYPARRILDFKQVEIYFLDQ